MFDNPQIRQPSHMNETFKTMPLDRMSDYLADLSDELVQHDPTLSAMAAMLSNVARKLDESKEPR